MINFSHPSITAPSYIHTYGSVKNCLPIPVIFGCIVYICPNSSRPTYCTNLDAHPSFLVSIFTSRAFFLSQPPNRYYIGWLAFAQRCLKFAWHNRVCFSTFPAGRARGGQGNEVALCTTTWGWACFFVTVQCHFIIWLSAVCAVYALSSFRAKK
jgi:hypothetical protein